MKYKDAIKQSMDLLAKDPMTRFIGYNTRCGGKANGTLVDVPENQLVETPVAENLMLGMATGMAIEGFKPVVYFERCDFILNAIDALVNHLDIIKTISKGEYDPKVIIRVVIGSTQNPLFTGATHTSDYSTALNGMLSNVVVAKAWWPNHVLDFYEQANTWEDSFIILEDRDLYDREEQI